jgi:hypothetical protein
MAYKITIGVNSSTPCPVIGAKACREHGCDRTEQVYGSQLRYRVLARLPDQSYALMSRRDAVLTGAEVIVTNPFPKK